MRRILVIVSILALGACSPRVLITRDLSAAEKIFKDHIGFMLYDLNHKKSSGV